MAETLTASVEGAGQAALGGTNRAIREVKMLGSRDSGMRDIFLICSTSVPNATIEKVTINGLRTPVTAWLDGELEREGDMVPFFADVIDLGAAVLPLQIPLPLFAVSHPTVESTTTLRQNHTSLFIIAFS